jgi:ABC-type antimicrobial peptide transport system permease subunit
MLDSIRGVAGVRSAALADVVPFTQAVPRSIRLAAAGTPETEAQPVFQYFVTKDYFDVLGIAMREGHTFDDEFYRYGTRLPPSGVVRMPAIVSQTIARRMLDGKAIGRELVAGKARFEVIGVVDDIKQRGVLDDDTAAIYLLLSTSRSAKHLVARTSQDTAPLLPILRGAVEQHRAVFPSSSAVLSEMVDETLVVERSRAILSSAYGLVALLLASVGLYGLAARLVAERRREIGIRVALGAGRHHVRRLVMADAWLIVGIGLIAGIPAALAASRVTQGLLFGVAPAAPHVLGMAALALAVAAITATLVPAWRANRIDPAVTLRDE